MGPPTTSHVTANVTGGPHCGLVWIAVEADLAGNPI